MSNDLLKVGEIISIPFPNGKTYDGEILHVNKCLHPCMKYEIGIDELGVVIFYSEDMIRKLLNGK